MAKTKPDNRRVTRFDDLWLNSAGVDRAVLDRCPSEQRKFVGLGAMVVVAASMGALSSTVAVATIASRGDHLGRWFVAAIPAGAFYGLVILSLERFILAIPINPIELDSDGHSPATGRSRRVRAGRAVRTLTMATPRLLLAGLVSFLIAEPLLLVIFKPEIDQRVEQLRTETAAATVDSIEERYASELGRLDDRERGLTPTDPRLALAVGRRQTIDAEIAAVEFEVANLAVEVRAERQGLAIQDGQSRTSGQAGDGPIAAQIEAQSQLAENRLEGLRERRSDTQQEIEDLEQEAADTQLRSVAELEALAEDRSTLATQRRRSLAAAIQQAEQIDGLLVRIDALHWLTRHNLRSPSAGDSAAGERVVGERTVAFYVVWALRLFILLIDSLPILAKTALSLRARRPYDTALAIQEHLEISAARSLLLPMSTATEPAANKPESEEPPKPRRTAAQRQPTPAGRSGKYSAEQRDVAVDRVAALTKTEGSEWSAICIVAEDLGSARETVRGWVRRSQRPRATARQRTQ